MTIARPHLKTIEQRLLWLACWTIHNANHLRPKTEGDVKVGGHQASCASMVSIMTALYFHALRPEDRVAVKPHAAPVFHAMQYLMGRQSREKLANFRGFGGAQSYPSRTKDGDEVDFSTGSVGLGVAMTAFASIVQDYLASRPWAAKRPLGRMIALVGDAELDEGNIYECLQEGWKHDLRNTWWIVDYNRQSLDGVVREGLWQRIEAIFGAFGWDVVRLKYGVLQRAAFAEPGGASLRDWIDNCPNQLYSALTYQGGAAWRRRLMDAIGDQGPVAALLDRRSDDALAALMSNLGGQCVETLAHAFGAVEHDRPVVFLAYTIKGWKTPLAGHKDNHAGLMTPAQMDEFQARMGVAPGQEWEPFATVDEPGELRAFLATVPFFAGGARRTRADMIEGSGPVFLDDRLLSTQAGFGKILDLIGRSGDPLADRIMTMSPDVTVSTSLGPWVNRRGLFARAPRADVFRDERIASTQRWHFGDTGQHVELGIAEMNLFLLLGAAGLSHAMFGERLLPVGTVYDIFIARGLDALNYACYQDARFLFAGTPSGVTLAPEGGAHQSIGSPLIGMAQDGLVSFEPAFLDELSIIVDWAFAYMQRAGIGPDKGGSVYLRLSTRPLEQPSRRIGEALAADIAEGAYWWRQPGPNAELVLAYQGCVAPEVLQAAGLLGERHRDIGVLAVTSADRLMSCWTARDGAASHVERLMSRLPRHCTLVTVIDGHPATLGWLGSVRGHRTVALGVTSFGETGSIGELYARCGIDTASIVRAAERHLGARLQAAG